MAESDTTSSATKIYFKEVDEGVLNDNGQYVLSTSYIEVLDLIGEGQVEGLVSGTYDYVGTAYRTGWDSATFTSYPYPPESSNNKYKSLRSIYWNEVPVVSSDNRYNYQRVDVDWTRGLENGEVISATNANLTVTRVIGERLRYCPLDLSGNPLTNDVDYSKIYRILNKECSGAIINIKVPTLYTIDQDTKNKETYGKLQATVVEYNIYYRPIFKNVNKIPQFVLAKKEKITGKVTTEYIRSTQINFYTSTYSSQSDFLGWEIKLIRLTKDSVDLDYPTQTRNATTVDSITEIYGDTYVYPNSAIIRSKFEAEFFSQIPARAFDAKLLRVKIPSTYNPITRSYSEPLGYWNGSFATNKQWTDNPVWCYYDLITNRNYGLGAYIDESYIDKWTLYEIAKYCDVLVPDGYGNLEPRFSCNVILTSRDEAYKVINDFTSIFQALSYYGAGSISVVQDSPKEPVATFTNANVENGDFTYSDSSRRVRSTVAVVRYNDQNNFYKPAVEYVEDIEGIKKHGIRETEITAFGCTSRGQALRYGRWKLLTEAIQTETISFIGGLDASILRPGDIVKVADNNRKITRYAGRTYNIHHINQVGWTGSKFTLDDAIPAISTGQMYNFSIFAPRYTYDASFISDLVSSDFSGIRPSFIQNKLFTGIYASGVTGLDNNIRTQISFYTPFDTGNFNLTGNLVWTIEPTGSSNFYNNQRFLDSGHDLYRVYSVLEKDGKYEVNGLIHSLDKFVQIESGLNFGEEPYKYLITPTDPENFIVAISDEGYGTKQLSYSFTVKPERSGITSHRVYAAHGTNVFTSSVPSASYLVDNLPYELNNYVQSNTYIPAQTGDYWFRVYAVNDDANVYSTGYASGYIRITGVDPITDVTISSLRLDSDLISTNAAGTTTTGRYYNSDPIFLWQDGRNSNTSIPIDYTYRITVRQPSNSNVPSAAIYYEETGVLPQIGTSKYTYEFAKNLLATGGPYREYDFVVEAMTPSGKTSAGNTVDPISENGWISYPNGYDIIYVNNERFTGAYLTTGGINPYENYLTNHWLDTNGDVNIKITSGSLPIDIVGGYIYTSTGLFSGYDIVTGSDVEVSISQFNYNSNIDVIKAKSSLNFYTSGYMAISFFDAFDYAYIEQGNQEIAYGGVAMSNVVPIFASGDISNLRATTVFDMHNPSNLLDKVSLHVMRTGENNKTYAMSSFKDDSNIEWIIHSKLL